MDTKNYEKGYEYTRFDFRRLLVEEFRDSELGWWIYGSSRFIEGRRMARILEIISGILDGGEGVGKVWVGFGVVLIFIGIFWDFSENSFPCVSPGCAYYFLHGTVAGMHSDVGL